MPEDSWTAHDVSTLTLLAEIPGPYKEQGRNLLEHLSGHSLEVGRALLVADRDERLRTFGHEIAEQAEQIETWVESPMATAR